jgi:hypothetical protein
MQKSLLSVIVMAASLAGCHAQVPPATGYKVSLSWTAPVAGSGWTGCTTTAPCVYAVYRCTATASTCGSTVNTAWSELTAPATRPSGTAYTDTTVASGVTAYYAVETVQGSANSGASNVVTMIVPGVPSAPALNTPTTAMTVRPALPLGIPEPTVYAKLQAPVLRIGGRQ